MHSPETITAGCDTIRSVYSHSDHFYSSSQMNRFNSEPQDNLWGLFTTAQTTLWSSVWRQSSYPTHLILTARAFSYTFPLKTQHWKTEQETFWEAFGRCVCRKGEKPQSKQTLRSQGGVFFSDVIHLTDSFPHFDSKSQHVAFCTDLRMCVQSRAGTLSHLFKATFCVSSLFCFRMLITSRASGLLN